MLRPQQLSHRWAIGYLCIQPCARCHSNAGRCGARTRFFAVFAAQLRGQCKLKQCTLLSRTSSSMLAMSRGSWIYDSHTDVCVCFSPAPLRCETKSCRQLRSQKMVPHLTFHSEGVVEQASESQTKAWWKQCA
eukprot:3027961-Amphidinium_carterae.1